MSTSDHGTAVDRTVCDPGSRAKIEDYYGVRLKDTDPRALAFVVAQSKSAGNEAFRTHRYKEAIRLYSQAIAGDESDAALYSNRSAAFLAEGLNDQALWDAEKCIALSPSWPKAHYRRACAAMSLCQWQGARQALVKGLELAPGDAAMVARLAEVDWVLTQRGAARRAQAAVERRGVVSRLRELRCQAARQAALRQFKQSMTGPRWDLEDLDWRPTFLPSMKTRPRPRAPSSPHSTLLRSYLSSLADLAGPKAALTTLADSRRWAQYEAALCTLGAAACHVLVLESGGGVLGPLAARAAPQASITSVQRGRMLYRMAKQVAHSNPGTRSEGLTLADCVQARLAVAGEEGPAPEGGVQVESRADVLVTDLMDHGVLGLGLLPAIDDAARRLLTPNAVVMPSSLQLVEVSPSQASGFDLSPLDSYRWWPGPEAVQLDSLPHRQLSAPFLVDTLDLQARARAAAAAHRCPPQPPAANRSAAWELDVELSVPTTGDGRLTAVAFWWDAELAPAAGPGLAPTRLTNRAPDGGPVTTCAVALQHLDGVAVKGGGALSLRVRRDVGQVFFSTSPPQCRARHALVPRWHFDMVRDEARNVAYDGAISRAVARLKSRRPGGVHVLDMGAGTGLLSMMAVRAGAASVVGAEINRHMCDVAEECLASNGCLGRVTMLDRDVRRMAAEPGPDCAPADLERRVDLLIYEVFDSGLIGEGVLHILAAAREKLAAPGALLVPASARVFAQPIQMRLESAAGFDVSQANRWRWRPDYEGVDLEECRNDWVALADPVEVFAFDFSASLENMRPASAPHELLFTEAGVVNAVATWFELELDEECTLSTSPHRSGKGPTWQQAVQWVREERVAPGQTRVLIASHDTYSISYALEEGAAPGPDHAGGVHFAELSDGAGELEDRATGVPLVDPVWKEAFDSLQPLNSQIVRACVQDPLEYRAIALEAVAFASRPHDYDLDASQATDFCVKMMG
ncbi:Protein arginine N-methyltransferase 7 [Auxenochlorella protothecoides]|uniref:Protein arginine N-methyltransferase 7 n=1 Tax=Auxenochlorella protothecoides TaxID=3075 RepID=A0A087SH18_AUXPR|nr:Protein arginine N-methyltransferase 7 [Auxenochlorella protothecoides]KFM25022.1 Protein arginine N-methyltransferase 7 [Auxenochlorella protothecoides]